MSSASGPKHTFCVAILLLLISALCAVDASAVRIMSYNTLNYPGSTGAIRSPKFQAIIADVAPDILVCQELTGLSGANTFRNNVLLVVDPGGWSMAPFTDGNDSDSALYYRVGEWTVVSYGALPTSPREIDWFQMRLNNGSTGVQADFVIYVGHLKASTGSSNEEIRRQSAEAIRDNAATWPAGTHFVVAGDFNFYDSGEPGWIEFTGVGTSPDGRFFDPVNFAGNWHDNAGYASVHSQSTRTTFNGDGGATGGCDDRFDFILINDDLTDGNGWEYVPGGYTTYGQDSQHFNLAINGPPTNAAVGQVLADALFGASDHLPIVVEFSEPANLDWTPSVWAFGTVIQGSAQVSNFQLDNTAAVPGDDLDWTGNSVPGATLTNGTSGSVPAASSASIEVTLDTSAVGALTPNLFFAVDSPGEEFSFIPVTGTVVRPASPSIDSLVVDVSDSLDFGTHAEGEFTNMAFAVHNQAYDADQAQLQVVSAAFTGTDAARFSLVGSLPALVGSPSLGLQVAFDDAGVASGITYTAQLTLSTADDPSIGGAASRSDIVIDLFATTSTGGVSTPPGRAEVTRLYAPTPSPFNPATEIRFDLREAGRVRIDVLDIRGRLVDVLVDGSFPAGEHGEVWNGQDRSGRAVSSGVYLFRMQAAGTVEVRRGVLVR